MLFSNIDIKDGYWRMIVERGKYLNFAYVIPDIPGARTRIVIQSTLQMGWLELPPFFCAATGETDRDLAEDSAKQPRGSLAPHLLEDLMLSLDKWPEEKLAAIFNKYLHVMEVYVDNFCTMVQTEDPHHLRHLSRSLLHAIHVVFPPPEVSGLDGGDPISNKKMEGEGK